MPVPAVTQGRGAWSKIGKNNGSRYYQATTPYDGTSPEEDVNYQAVHLGIKGIQRRANQLVKGSTKAPVPVDGVYGPQDREIIKFVQRQLGFTGAAVDGVVGPKTAKGMWKPVIAWVSDVYDVPPEHLWGMTALESAFDPCAVGYTTPSDRGLCQINLVAHPGITVEEAFDPFFALNYSANRLARARDRYDGKGPQLQDLCSIAQHNSPLAAETWYEIGWVGDDEKIKKYVDLVLQNAATY